MFRPESHNVNLKKWILLSFVATLISGCMTKTVIVDRAIVHNMTGQVITDVLVVHEPTGKTGATNRILQGKNLEIGFPETGLLAKRAVISWRDHEGVMHSKTIVIPPVGDKQDVKARSLTYVIMPEGSVSVSLQ